MSIFYQHIGAAMWARDAPRTLGTENSIRRFTLGEIESYLIEPGSIEIDLIRQKERELAPTGFQIWGLPSGAQKVLSNLASGDFLLLLESDEFKYVGQVWHRISEPCWELSTHLWGEQKFPLIVFLQGQMISYEWNEFRSHFGFDPKYHMRGNTARIAPSRLASSQFDNEEAFISFVIGQQSVNRYSAVQEFQLFSEVAEAHMRLVKERAHQGAFRLALLSRQGSCCAVCGFSVLEGLEAAHLVPKSAKGSDDPRNGIVLCALHHKLFDAGLFYIDPDSMEIVVHPPWTPLDLKITNGDIREISSLVHEDAIRWNADKHQELR